MGETQFWLGPKSWAGTEPERSPAAAKPSAFRAAAECPVSPPTVTDTQCVKQALLGGVGGAAALPPCPPWLNW